MKVTYSKNIVETLNRKVVYYNRLKKNREGFNGKQFEMPVFLGSSNSTGARGHAGNLPGGGSDEWDKAVITQRYNYVRMTAYNTVDSHAGAQAGAWEKVRAGQVKRRTKDLADDMSRQTFGNGVGILCEAKAITGGGLTVEIADQPDAKANDSDWAPDTTKFMKKGLKVCWGAYAGGVEFAAGTPVAAGYGYVASVTDKTSFVVVKTAGADPSIGDIFVKGEGLAEEDNAFNKEIMGLAGFTTAINVQEITDTRYRAQSVGSATVLAPILEDDMSQCVDLVDEETDGQANAIVCHSSARRAYVKMLKAKNGEQFAPTKVKGGYDREYLTFAATGRNIPLVEDKDAEHYTMLFLDEAELMFKELKGFSWDESSGGVWKWVSGKDQATGFGKLYTNMCVKNRQALCRLQGIAVTGINR